MFLGNTIPKHTHIPHRMQQTSAFRVIVTVIMKRLMQMDHSGDQELDGEIVLELNLNNIQ